MELESNIKTYLRKVLKSELKNVAKEWNIKFVVHDSREQIINKIFETDLNDLQLKYLRKLGEAYYFQTKASAFLFNCEDITKEKVFEILKVIGCDINDFKPLEHYRISKVKKLISSLVIEIQTPTLERTIIDYFGEELNFKTIITSIINFNFDKTGICNRIEIICQQSKKKDFVRLINSDKWFWDKPLKPIDLNHRIIHHFQEEFDAIGTTIIQRDGADSYDEVNGHLTPLAQTIKSAKYNLLELRDKSQLFAEECDIGIFLLLKLKLEYRTQELHFEINFDKNCINFIYITPRDAYIKLIDIIDKFYE